MIEIGTLALPKISTLFGINIATYNEIKSRIGEIIENFFNTERGLEYEPTLEYYIYAYIGAKSVGYIPNLDVILPAEQVSDLYDIIAIIKSDIVAQMKIFSSDISLSDKLQVTELEKLYHSHKMGNNRLIDPLYQSAIDYTEIIINYILNSNIDISLNSSDRRFLMISLEVGKILAYAVSKFKINITNIELCMKIITFMLFIGRDISIFSPPWDGKVNKPPNYNNKINAWIGNMTPDDFKYAMMKITQFSIVMINMRENEKLMPNNIIGIILPLYPLCHGIKFATKYPVTEVTNNMMRNVIANAPFIIDNILYSYANVETSNLYKNKILERVGHVDTETVDIGFSIFSKVIELIDHRFGETTDDMNFVVSLMSASMGIAIKLNNDQLYVFIALVFRDKSIVAIDREILDLLPRQLSQLWAKNRYDTAREPIMRNRPREYPVVPDISGFKATIEKPELSISKFTP